MPCKAMCGGSVVRRTHQVLIYLMHSNLGKVPVLMCIAVAMQTSF